jgi:predicted ATPase with chaperone activity
MRQPLEDRVITISRAKSTVDYPASLMVVFLKVLINWLNINMLKNN